MTAFNYQTDRLSGLSEPLLLALLEQASGESLVSDWLPRLSELSVSARLVDALMRQCESTTALDAIKAAGFLHPASALSASQIGRWLLVRLHAKDGCLEMASELAFDLLDELPEYHLALDACSYALKLRDLSGARRAFAAAVWGAPDYAALQKVNRWVRRLDSAGAWAGYQKLRVAYLAQSAPQLIEPVLRAMGFASGLDLEIYSADYNTVDQEILDPRSGLHAFEPEVVILATNYRALNWVEGATEASDWVADQLTVLQDRWKALSSQFGCPVIQHTLDLPTFDPMGHLAASVPDGKIRLLTSLNAAVAAAAPDSVRLVDVSRLQAQSSAGPWVDERLWLSARQYPAPAQMPGLVSEYMAIIRAKVGRTKKLLILDLDHTLWGGVIGEDGLAGIRVGVESPEAEAHAEFQSYLLALKQRGILLAVCSKNNEADARLPFEAHDGMRLRLDDFVAFKANWEPKSTNIEAIANELNLGLESVVFLDDNPAERLLVRQQLPAVTVPSIGPDPADYIAQLHRGRWFEPWGVTVEDRMRSETYRTEAQRRAVREQAPTIEAYLQSLRMSVVSGTFQLSQLERLSQLTLRTNQFNLSNQRRGVDALKTLMGQEQYRTRGYILKDRFGSSGLAAMWIVDVSDSDWRVDTFLISCRVMGRGLEDYMLNELIAAARQHSVSRILASYVPSPKNGPVKVFLERHNFQALSGDLNTFAIEPANYQPVPTQIRAFEA